MKPRPQEMDELLERIWTQKEKGENRQSELLQATPVSNGESWLKKLTEEGFAVVEKDSVNMTDAGEKEAREIIRRHRLTERLFADVFQTSEETWEKQACEMEHASVLAEEAVNAICAFLGHPPSCPHGSAIPPGPCCKKFEFEVQSFVIPLSEAKVAQPYRIVFMAPRKNFPLDRLAVLGILPGNEVRIRQKRPSYVIQTGETDVALDEEIVRAIYVRNVTN